MNPWHDVHYGENAPEIVKAIIEIPKGSKGKYEIDKESGLIKLDRALFSAVHYPANYGFIPKTYADDKDPLDILVITCLTSPPAHALRPVIPINACTLRITAAAGT